MELADSPSPFLNHALGAQRRFEMKTNRKRKIVREKQKNSRNRRAGNTYCFLTKDCYTSTGDISY